MNDVVPERFGVTRAEGFRSRRFQFPSTDAWQATMKAPPDFHVVKAFGVLRFETQAW